MPPHPTDTDHHPGSRAPDPAPCIDAFIIGGGISGTWLLNLLHNRGYRVVLFEADAIGCQQTLGSQGMIHGGLKYALSGRLTQASEAIADMPRRWRECLAGRGEVDLTGLDPLSERYYLFAERGSLGRLATFFASRVLRGRIEKLPEQDRPESLAGLDGVVYALHDFVLHTPALLERLTRGLEHLIYRHRVEAGDLQRCQDGWQLTTNAQSLKAHRLILAAGAGNGALINGLGLPGPAMQLRPLQQVVVRHSGLPDLYAHCLTGVARAEPRLTITSHPDHSEAGGDRLWYLGGQLATDGVSRTPDAQIDQARQELVRCVPWIDWQGATLETLRWERAEPAQQSGRRPDEACVVDVEGALVCWPTKLCLAPDLGDRVLAALDPPDAAGRSTDLPLPHASLGRLPWER